MEQSKIIYKYRNWSIDNHKNCLLKNQLYFAAPGELNDPYDFKIHTDFSLLDTDYKKLQYINLAINNYSKEQLQQLGDVNAFRKRLFSFMKLNSEQFQSEYDAKETARSSIRFGILCFSLKWNNILMWTHYANSSKGFCIGLNREKIEAAKIGMSGLVKYQDEFPSIDPLDTNHMEKIIKQMHFKATPWSYEEEYRISIIKQQALWPSDRLYVFPDDFLEEIILGLNISEKDENDILRIAKIKNVPAFKIVKKRNSFNFERKPCKYEYFV
jgi:hypothetical protein